MGKKSKKEIKSEQEQFKEEIKLKDSKNKKKKKIISYSEKEINSDNEEEIIKEKYIYEDKILDSIEKIESKDRETRIEGLKILKELISKNFIFDFLFNEKENLIEICLSILQKSLNEFEIDFSTSIICLLILTYEEDLIDCYEKIKKIFKFRMIDESISFENRNFFLSKIGIIEFILSNEEDEEEIFSNLNELKIIWSKESNNEILNLF